MSVSDTAQQDLRLDIDALVNAFMADAPLTEIIPIVDRIGAAMDYWDGIPASAVAELRSAIDLMRGGQSCATISALLTARAELSTPPA